MGKKSSKKPTRQELVKQLDNVFSVYIRLRDSNSKGIVVCPLCGARMPWKKAQNMHFISRGNFKYRWDERNCHAGCMRCNVFLNGNYIAYTRWMQKTYGIEFVDKLIADKGVCKIPTPSLVEMIQHYINKAILQEAKIDITAIRGLTTNKSKCR